MKSPVSIKLLAIAVGMFALVGIALLFFSKYQPEQAATQRAEIVLALSEASKEELRVFVNREPQIIGVAVVSISLAANKRVTTFFYSTDTALQAAAEKYELTRTTSPDVFSNNGEFNQRISSIITGHFECLPTKDIQIDTEWPVSQYAETTCAISVPPVYSEKAKLVGYFSFFINGVVTPEDHERLGKEAAIMASDIYKRDIRHE